VALPGAGGAVSRSGSPAGDADWDGSKAAAPPRCGNRQQPWYARGMSAAEDEERALRIALMQADIANKEADTAYKQGLLRYEPWKVVGVAFGAGAAVMGAAVALVSAFFHLTR
jgi:hypothetical protein